MKYLALSFIFLLFASPALAHDGAQSDADAIKANIVAMWAAVERGDVEGYLKYVHEDYTLFGESDIYLLAGKDKERASYEDYLDRYENIRTFMHQPEVTIRGDTAWITYYWTDTGYSKAGVRFTSKGKSTRIFVKENDRWMCIHGHFTAVE